MDLQYSCLLYEKVLNFAVRTIQNLKIIMMKNLLISAFILLFAASLSYSGDDIGQKKDRPNQKQLHSRGNNFTEGVPLESPVFIDSWGPESFEPITFPPAGWSRFTAAANIIRWERMTVGQLPPGWNPGFGLEVTAPPGGGTAVALATYDAQGPLTNDIWLVTPRIYNVQTTDSLVFWISKKAEYADHLDVKASKTVNNLASAFNITIALLSYPPTNGDSAWVRKSYPLNASGIVNGDSLYIGFREWVLNNLNDGGIIQIDLVQGIGSQAVSNGNISGLVNDRFSLAQNYPNPFNPSTTIYYNLPKSANVKLVVFDVLGNEVTTLVNEYKLGGTHKIDFNAGNLASGIYFYKLLAGDYVEVRKMTLIK